MIAKPTGGSNRGSDHIPGLSPAGTIKGNLQRVVLSYMKVKKERGETPTSIRFLFYELEQLGHVSKRMLRQDGTPGKRKGDADLIAAITWLRDGGFIPWDWINDESRSLHNWDYAPTISEYVSRSVYWARIDRWIGTKRPVIITESRGTAGVLEHSVGQDFLVAIAPTGGMCRGFIINEIAPLLADEDTRVLYVGDADLAGNQIEENTRRVLEHSTGRTFGESTWERVALTKEQTDEMKARGIEPIEKSDNRYSDGRKHLAYEAEAVGQSAIIQIVRTRLEQLLPEPLEGIEAREEAERAGVWSVLNAEEHE